MTDQIAEHQLAAVQSAIRNPNSKMKVTPLLRFINGSELDYPNCQAIDQRSLGGLRFTPQTRNEKSRTQFCRPAGHRSGFESAGAHGFVPTVSSHPMSPMC